MSNEINNKMSVDEMFNVRMEDLAKMFKADSKPELNDRLVSMKKHKLSMVYNENNNISNTFEQVDLEVKEKSIKIVHMDNYDYDCSPVSLTRGEMSRLFNFVFLYDKKKNNTVLDQDLEVVVGYKGNFYAFCLNYSPTMPEFLECLVEVKEGSRVYQFEEMLETFPNLFPPVDEWTREDILFDH